MSDFYYFNEMTFPPISICVGFSMASSTKWNKHKLVLLWNVKLLYKTFIQLLIFGSATRTLVISYVVNSMADMSFRNATFGTSIVPKRPNTTFEIAVKLRTIIFISVIC